MTFQKGVVPWNKGKKDCYTEEVLLQMSLAKKNKLLTKEHKRKISVSLIGHIKTLETREKLSHAKKGKAPEGFKKLTPFRFKKGHNKGIPHTLEHRRKIGLAQRGENSHNWKGGITSLKEKIRDTIEYKEWRKAVFQRDNYICQDCKIEKNYVEADHIKAFTVILRENNIKTLEEALVCKELWDVNNGRTLCKPCHRKTSTWGNSLK